MFNDIKFYEILLSQNLLTTNELEILHLTNNKEPYLVLLYLKKEQKLPSDLLGKLWADSINKSYVNLDKSIFQNEIVQMIPEYTAKKYSIIPLYKGKSITVAMSDPTNSLILTEIEKIIGENVFSVFAFPDEIEEAINLQYSSIDKVIELSTNILSNNLIKDTDIVSKERLELIAGDQLVVKLIDELILYAVKERATDIHIEPGENNIRIRYRIDGYLQDKIILDKSLLAPLVSRIKVIANTDIVEKRRPQDGRITYKYKNTEFDIRFSVIPILEGERIVLRLLGKTFGRNVPNLSDLYFSKYNFQLLKKIIETPNGIFLITGPTGSGKTTTLFSMLKNLNTEILNIITIEDPVEYKLKGLNQLQVNNEIGLNFSTALRSVLRQDPDIILVGEIRDTETAQIASQAALTGHLILSTLHTNNAIQAINRLVEIGVEPYFVAPAIIAVMAQRLVRRICESCKKPYTLSKEEVNKYFYWDNKAEAIFYRGDGCNKCNNTGYYGRIPIHEIFLIDEDIKELIMKQASCQEIMKSIYVKGYKTMWYDGLKKVLRGLTTIEELKKEVLSEEISQ
ncbi:MAG: GspE/PulE family protein [Cyanobacteriota bacterium]